MLPGQNILAGEMPEIQWVQGDDLCDCTFQRIGDWTNPYIGRTLRVRMCCIWAEIYKEYPQFVQEIPAFYNYNEDKFEDIPWMWDGETDMPKDIWHRQLAVMRQEPLDVIREKFEGIDPPKGTPKPKSDVLQVTLTDVISAQGEQIAALQHQVGSLMDILGKIAQVDAGEDVA